MKEVKGMGWSPLKIPVFRKQLMHLHGIGDKSRAVYMNPGSWERRLLTVNFHLLRFQVPHLQGEAFQEIEPVTLWRIM